jgi:hypothetical protein
MDVALVATFEAICISIHTWTPAVQQHHQYGVTDLACEKMNEKAAF